MTDIVTNRATDFDGSGAPATMAVTGTLQVTYSGSGGRTAAMQLWSRTDTANYAPLVPVQVSNKFGVYAFDLLTGTNYYFTLVGVASTDSLDISAVEG